MKLSAEDKLSKAIIQLQKPQPFFSYLMMWLMPRELDAAAPMQTMGVDAKGHLHYNVDFVETLSEDELMGTLCHEVIHVALLHMTRTGDKNLELANIAQDVIVNMMVKQAEMSLPSGTIPYDLHRDLSSFSLNGVPIDIRDVSKKTWEQVYYEILSKLNSEKAKLPNQSGERTLGFDMHMRGESGESKPLTPSEIREIEAKWQQTLAEAARYAKMQGNIPAGFERYIGDILKPRVEWKTLLLKYIKQYLNPVDWTYQKPHKKSSVLEVYLPNTLKESCDIEVIVDTSGSISKKELTVFLSEIVAIAKALPHLHMSVSFIDMNIHTRYEVENGDIPKILSMKPTGGGGTDMERGLDYIKETNQSVPVVIVLTDGYTSYNKSVKDYPFDVIWVITSNGISHNAMSNIPYGIKIKMEE
jgi:predicted metal-dependent peptidase